MYSKNYDNLRRLWNNFLSLSVLQIASYLLPLITVPYLFRVLGADNFGLIALVQAFMVYVAVAIDYGFSIFAVKEIALHRNNIKKLSEIVSAIYSAKSFFSVVAWAVLLILVYNWPIFKEHTLLVWFAFFSVVMQQFFPVWFFQGIEDMSKITKLTLIAKVLFTMLVFILIKEKSDYIYVPLLQGVGNTVAAVIAWRIMFKRYRIAIRCKVYEKTIDYIKASSHFFLSRVAVSVYTSSNTLFLGLSGISPAYIGYYALAEKAYTALQKLYQPIVSVLYPFVAKEKNIELFKRIFKIVLVVNIIASFILYSQSDTVMKILGAQTGVQSAEIFKIFMLINLITVPSILLGYPFLAALGYASYANNSVIVAAIFHLGVLSILFVANAVTIYSVVWLLAATQIIDLSIRIYGVYKYRLWGWVC
jgi:PST family polysaccharide transporter